MGRALGPEVTVYFWIAVAVVIILAFFLLRSFIRRQDPFYEVDRMEGLDFEDYLVELIGRQGYDVMPTQASRDFGADLIIHTPTEEVVIQAKCYQQKVGLEAVQQVAAAVPYYRGTRGVVITNNYYTDGAYELAQPNQVILLNRDDLGELMEGVPFMDLVYARARVQL